MSRNDPSSLSESFFPGNTLAIEEDYIAHGKNMRACYPVPSLTKVPTTESPYEWKSTVTNQGHLRDPQEAQQGSGQGSMSLACFTDYFQMASTMAPHTAFQSRPGLRDGNVFQAQET